MLILYRKKKKLNLQKNRLCLKIKASLSLI
jgi:hypothetical protein